MPTSRILPRRAALPATGLSRIYWVPSQAKSYSKIPVGLIRGDGLPKAAQGATVAISQSSADPEAGMKPGSHGSLEIGCRCHHPNCKTAPVRARKWRALDFGFQSSSAASFQHGAMSAVGAHKQASLKSRFYWFIEEHARTNPPPLSRSRTVSPAPACRQNRN